MTITQSGDLNSPVGNVGQADEPLKLTIFPWRNASTETGERTKVMLGLGSMEQYKYGTVTTLGTPGFQYSRRLTQELDWVSENLTHEWELEGWVGIVQEGIVCTPESGVIAVDVDDAQEYERGPLAKVLPLRLAASRRGEGGHILIDARAYRNTELWPLQATKVFGCDIKSNGFVPVPGSLHKSGELYAATGESVVVATDDIMRALCEAREASVGHGGYPRAGGERPKRSEDYGYGDDDTLTRATYGWVFQGLDENEVREQWYELAEEIQTRSDWPFTEHDFQRHYRGAVRKHSQHMGTEQARLKEEQEAEERVRQDAQDRLRAQRMRGLARAREVREQHKQNAEQLQSFMVNLGKTPLRETPETCVPHPDHEDQMTLLTGHGSIVTETWKIAKIFQYQSTMWSFDWHQQADERLLALDILAKLKSDEDVRVSDPWLADRQDTLDTLLKDHPTLLGRTTNGRIVALEGDSEEEDYAWRCTECSHVHRLKHWPNLPPHIVLAQGCPLETGMDVAHDRKGQKLLVALYALLRMKLEDKAKAEGRPFNPTRDRVTGKILASAWNGGERGEYACLSINKINRLLRKLSFEQALLIRLRKPRNYLRKHRCRTASPVYGLPSERPELTSPDQQVREEAERRLQVEDDIEWASFWMRREQTLTEVHEARQAVAA